MFLPTAKRKSTGDGQQSDPLAIVTETNSATAAATEEIECSDHSDKCETTCSEMVAPDTNEPEITTQQGASTMNMTSIHVERNIEEPDLEVLSVPQRDDNTGITGGQLSLDIGDLVSSCTTEVDLSLKGVILAWSCTICVLFKRSEYGSCYRKVQ